MNRNPTAFGVLGLVGWKREVTADEEAFKKGVLTRGLPASPKSCKPNHHKTLNAHTLNTVIF